jgi:hypothetical protein
MAGDAPSTTRRSLRERVSDAVNRLTWTLLAKYELRVPVGRGSHNLLTTLRRFQLTYLEAHFVAILERRRRAGTRPRVRLEVSALTRPPRPRWKRLLDVAAGLARSRGSLGRLAGKVARRVRTHVILKRRRPVPVAGVTRLFFVDAGEVKRSHVSGRGYVYQKYLEGLLDLDGMAVGADTLVVLYGPLHELDHARLTHDRVVLLDAHRDPSRPAQVGALIERAAWEAWYGSGGVDPALSSLLASHRGYLEALMRADLGTIVAAERLLEHFHGPLEIVLDSYDSTLFPLSQYLLEHHPEHRIVAIQKVLGPYTFSWNIRGHGGRVRQPHRILTWGTFHCQMLARLGYTCELVPARLFKLEAYGRYLTLERDEIRRRVGVPAGLPVVMVSAVQRVVGFSLVDRWEYTQMLAELAELANGGRCFVLFKPWPGEDPRPILEIASAWFRRNWTLMASAPGEPFHNVELLRITDVMVSTVSSFIGEALFFGAVPILIDTPAAQAYFSREYTDLFRQLCYPGRGSVAETVREVLDLDEARRQAWRAGAGPAFARIFGDAR